jgi:hypothetical protein
VFRSLLVVLVAAAVLVAPAAPRRPTASERAAITATVRAYITMPGSPAAHDNRIKTITVSSLDPRYAAVRVESPSVGFAEMVLHHSGPAWWVLEFGSSLGCNTAPAAVLRQLAVSCAPPDATAWINDCGPLVSSPRQLTLACADGNYSLTNLRWRHWAASAATASGAARANDCKPYCAAGHFHSYPVTVTVDRLTRCGSARYYARLTITYANARPAGVARRDVHTLGC